MSPQRQKSSRLSIPEWVDLCGHYTEVANGAADPRFKGDLQAWQAFLAETMPLKVRSHEPGEAARESGRPELLDIVYNGITTSGHLNFCLRQERVDRMTYEAILRFHERFNIPIGIDDLAALMMHALQAGNPNLINDIPRVNEQDMLNALQRHPGLLEHSTPGTAPVMAVYLRGWVLFSHVSLLPVFLRALRAGRAKTINALLAAGFSPFASSNARPKKGLFSAVLDRDPSQADVFLPPSLLDTLQVIDPEGGASNHLRLSRQDLFQPDAVEYALALSRDEKFAGLARADWRRSENDTTFCPSPEEAPCHE